MAKGEKLKRIADSKHFHPEWEKLQGTMGRVLTEAYYPGGTVEGWVGICNKAKEEIDNLKSMGNSIRRGVVTE